MMKNTGRFRRQGVLALLLCVLFAGEATAKPRLAIRAFENKTPEQVPASAITEMMTTELYNAGLFALMERERLDVVTDEIFLGQSGLVDSSTAPEFGKIRGAQYTLTGAVTVYHYRAGGGVVAIPGIAGGAAAKTAYVTLDIRVIDNTTSEVVYAAAEQGRATREAAGIVTRFGGFATASYGGILATATRDAVARHVTTMKEYGWE
ncbi:MAG: CsgG/HfaB family protein [Synergistaceae bacterium]|jgi:curli biogenesis system outer membrane secretion channel CsgG|nr:CsgG/HfaB family protein [Synergistaceae bacterium]